MTQVKPVGSCGRGLRERTEFNRLIAAPPPSELYSILSFPI
ncbi:hypothetical protein JMJ77_0005707 [Colletotrichum scovillei]|uniref:Uncharacterized protein n=1 Tax=Colletotrichum scovillei TaxID=1209932 RepID=A0A9P7UIH8_9PEZI|nr:hypothetical protein JMJ77_0005707 [Colletotrichum scovillei]KAG7076931.1 hypothetical protein JMJ76_0014187 [Colletotrichum scovillei]KAG7084045.1 hypothetical protein JMJ78_0009485 [Colletotrichum scovillei]